MKKKKKKRLNGRLWSLFFFIRELVLHRAERTRTYICFFPFTTQAIEGFSITTVKSSFSDKSTSPSVAFHSNSHQISHKILKMKHCKANPRTHSPPCSKWHHFDLCSLWCIAPLLFHVSLWLELHRVLPHIIIPPHFCHCEIDYSIFWYCVSLQWHLCKWMRQHEVSWRVLPQPLHDYCFDIWQLSQVYLFNFISSTINNPLDFLHQLCLRILVLHQIRHDPL